MSREGKKMFGKLTKKPFYMLAMESFYEWLSSLNSCPGDLPFFLCSPFSYSEGSLKLQAKLPPLQRGINITGYLKFSAHSTVML